MFRVFLLELLLFVGISITGCESEVNKLYPLTEKWEKVIPHLDVPNGLSSISAQHCGECHKDHYEEWKVSTHAHAWSDLQFQSELKKETSPFFCINCHIPLQDQQEYIVQGKLGNDIYRPKKIQNPHFDKTLQHEAITCAVCHIRNGTIISTQSRNLAPHKTKVDKDFLSEQLCMTCHNATATINAQLVCTFETGEEWKSGPYSGSKNCISCHMEARYKPIVTGFKSMKSHFHSFPGAGIAKDTTYTPARLDGLNIEVDQPHSIQSVGDSLDVELRLTNAFAGHRLPTGDPERFILITMTLVDAIGDTLVHKINRIGEEWEWYPIAKQLSDNNLLPGEERGYKLPFKFVKTGVYILFAKVSKHRMDQKTRTINHLGAEYPISIEVWNKTIKVEVK